MTRALAIVPLAFLLAPAATALGEGPKPLFNGKDLSGWVAPADPELFKVEQGEIVGRTKGDLKKNEFLVTERPYKNFVLRVKSKIKNGNSGVQFRSKRAEDGAVAGPQADIAEGYWGLLYEERGRGVLDNSSVEKAKSLLKADDYNEYVIKVVGDQLTMSLNGVVVVERADPEFAKEGIVALQVHVGPAMEVRFKDVTIEELD